MSMSNKGQVSTAGEDFRRFFRGQTRPITREELNRPKHVTVQPECGLCGLSFAAPGKKFVAFHYLSDTREICHIPHKAVAGQRRQATISCPREKRMSDHRFHKLMAFCWVDRCTPCSRGFESFAVHIDCFNAFRDECNTEGVVDRLFTAVEARRPWDGAPSMQVAPTETDGPAVELVHKKSDGIGLRRKRQRPLELALLMGWMTAPKPFGQAIAATQCGRELGRALPSAQSLLRLPLKDISSWSRGDQPILHEARDYDFSVIRLTYDWRGIREIERLPWRDLPTRRRHVCGTAHTVVEETDMIGVIAQFEYGILRLVGEFLSKNFIIWDIPDPPRLTDTAFSRDLHAAERFRTIDLRAVTGLTFFYSRIGRLLSCHGHTAEEPTAESTFNQINAECQPEVLWIYCPVSTADRITALGVRSRAQEPRPSSHSNSIQTQLAQPNFLIRTALAGDISIGHHYPHYNDVVLCQSNPSLLVHNADMYPDSATVGVYPQRKADKRFVPFQPLWRDVKLPASYSPERENFSAAPLRGVSRIQVFVRDTARPRCQGILFDYTNGAERAVGECRIGVGPSTTYTDPVRICIRLAWEAPARQRHARHGVFGWYQVEAGYDIGHTHNDVQRRGSWACYALTGDLSFWFAPDCTAITVNGGLRIPRRRRG